VDVAVVDHYAGRRQEMERRMTDHYVRPDVAAFLTFLNNVPGPKMHELSADDARQQMRVMGHVAELPVGDLAMIQDIAIPGPAGPIPARLYDARERREAGPVMVFFHGGGFVIGDLETHGPYCAEAARQLDMPVISVDYRLAPEHVWPAAPEDCEAAARWVAENIPCTGLVLSGDSAGGNLTIVTAMSLRDRPAAVPVIAQNPIYPVVSDHNDWDSFRNFADGYLLSTEGMIWFGDAYQSDPADYRAAPLNHDHTGMPPTLVITASLDPLHDQGVAYVAALQAAGVDAHHIEADGNIHGLINLRKAIPSAQDDVSKNLSVLKGLLAGAMVDA
jgi:acetyl esterase